MGRRGGSSDNSWAAAGAFSQGGAVGIVKGEMRGERTVEKDPLRKRHREAWGYVNLNGWGRGGGRWRGLSVGGKKGGGGGGGVVLGIHAFNKCLCRGQNNLLLVIWMYSLLFFGLTTCCYIATPPPPQMYSIISKEYGRLHGILGHDPTGIRRRWPRENQHGLAVGNRSIWGTVNTRRRQEGSRAQPLVGAGVDSRGTHAVPHVQLSRVDQRQRHRAPNHGDRVSARV